MDLSYPMSPKNSIYIGFDPREVNAFAVAKNTCKKYVSPSTGVHGIVLEKVHKAGLYYRPTSRRPNLWDDISNAPMSTEFAISRFLTPYLAGEGIAMFMDCDMLVRASLAPAFDYARQNPQYAVCCVKHNHCPTSGVKMDGQLQTVYSRKNWSSVMVFNCEHPSNQKLTVDLINTARGLHLHQFCWLEDHEIGELPPEWNYLVGETKIDTSPKVVHFTSGIPTMPGYENSEFSDEWRAALHDWAIQ